MYGTYRRLIIGLNANLKMLYSIKNKQNRFIMFIEVITMRRLQLENSPHNIQFFINEKFSLVNLKKVVENATFFIWFAIHVLNMLHIIMYYKQILICLKLINTSSLSLRTQSSIQSFPSKNVKLFSWAKKRKFITECQEKKERKDAILTWFCILGEKK